VINSEVTPNYFDSIDIRSVGSIHLKCCTFECLCFHSSILKHRKYDTIDIVQGGFNILVSSSVSPDSEVRIDHISCTFSVDCVPRQNLRIRLGRNL
jgi:hypothetical protein